MYWITVNPRISPQGLICKNELFAGGLFEGGSFKGRGYSKGSLFQSLVFSSMVDIKTTNFSNKSNKELRNVIIFLSSEMSLFLLFGLQS